MISLALGLKKEMGYLPYVFCTALLSWVCVRHLVSNLSRRLRQLPPGPSPLPIFGNLFRLGDKPHISLARLARTYGPVMWLELGSLRTVVISSSTLAKEVMKKQDASFSHRTVSDVVRASSQCEFSMVWLPPGATWRNMRKIANSQVFSSSRLDASSELRMEKVRELLLQLESCSRDGVAVEIGQVAFNTVLNLLCNTFFSVDFTELTNLYQGAGSRRDFKETVREIMIEAGKPNFSDYLPWVKGLDLQGIRGRMELHFNKLLDLFQAIVDRRLLDGLTNSIREDALDAMLRITQQQGNNNEGFDCKYIRHMLLDLLVAGTDTTSSTLEWAMTELLRNPEKMKKAQRELESVIGIGNTNIPVNEADISKLPYLEAVIKETFRLHPAAPFLIPRKAVADVKLGVFLVPKDSQVLINVWAIGKDPRLWENADSFEPERFLGSAIDVKGQDFELTPFGAGRRICPGMPLAIRMLPMMLASLIHAFDWKLEDGVTPQYMDMEEKFGITLQKAQPLRAIPIAKLYG